MTGPENGRQVGSDIPEGNDPVFFRQDQGGHQGSDNRSSEDRTNMMFSLLHMKSAGYFKPPSEETPESLALELFMTDGMDAAIPPFEVLAHASGAPEYLVFLCFCYIMANRGTDAVLISERFADSEEQDFCLIRAIAFRSVGCLHDAEIIIQDVLTKSPDCLPALNMSCRDLVDRNDTVMFFHWIKK